MREEAMSGHREGPKICAPPESREDERACLIRWIVCSQEMWRERCEVREESREGDQQFTWKFGKPEGEKCMPHMPVMPDGEMSSPVCRYQDM
jgi:hypothetical protein